MQIATEDAGQRGPTTPPLEPQSGFLLSDRPRHNGDGNGRWLPAGADTATAQPEQGSTEHQSAVLEGTGSNRRRHAVEAYCVEMYLSAERSSGAAEALDSSAGGDDLDLLRTVRASAAKRVNPIPEELRGWRNVLSVQRMGECTSTPALLAARDNDELSGEKTRKLEDHLDSCITCQALELRSRRAERTFAAIMRMTPLAAGAGADGEGPSATSEAATGPAEARPASKSGSPEASGWLPAELASAPAVAAPAAPMADTVSTPVAEPRGSSQRRRGIMLGVAAALAAAAIAAGALLASGSSNGVSAARRSVAAKPAVTARARHRAVRRSPTVHGQHPAAHAGSGAVAAAPAASASAAPAPQASSAPASQPSATPAPASSAPSSPTPSGPGPSTPAPSSPTPAQSGASFDQPSLGATNAPQGIGSKH